MQITSHLHTAILVSDLAKSEHFYSNILGLQKVNRTLKFSGIWYQIGEFQLHLIVDPNWRPNLMNQEKLGRNPHLAFAVKDLEMIKKHLEENNCVTQISASGRAALFTQDPDGNIIELTVPTAG